MAILKNRTIYRTNNLDLDININRAVGVSLPFNGTAVFNSTYTVKEQLKSNLINLVLTYPGERINEPNFGVGISKYIFESNIEQEGLLNEISIQSKMFLPQVEILDLKIGRVKDNNTIQVNVIYRVKIDNTIENIQLNLS